MNNNILEEIKKNGGTPLFVGGCVRDKILGTPSKDIDIEVYNLGSAELINVLSQFGKVNAVGVSFGVIKLTTADGQDFDFSLPRRDNKTGQGHKGFQVEIDPAMTPEIAASRRDFTWNSLAETSEGEILDFFGGVEDLKNKVIRHTSPAFAEDPLRVLRAFQFAGRFDMTSAPETIELCQELAPEFGTLAIERVWGEFEKWAGKSVKPSAGLRFLKDSGWLAHFPELAALVGCPQDPIWHPEGDVWEHTLQVVDQAAGKGVVIVLAALCHDMGKPETTTKNSEGRWTSPGHNNPAKAEAFLGRIGCPKEIANQVVELVENHMVHLNEVNQRTVRRLLARLKHSNIGDLLAVIEADHSGRLPLPGGMPDRAKQIGEIAQEMGNKVEPILQGRHLIEMGHKPGKHFGEILSRAFEAQLDGVFTCQENGKRWLSENI